MRRSKDKRLFGDLVEFYGRWPDLRRSMVNLNAGDRLSEEQADILTWMVRLLDRLGPADINNEGDEDTP